MAMKIAVAGEIRSGKDTVSNYIRNKIPFMERLYFAQGIEEVIRSYFPEAWDENNKPRKHYQDVGQLMRSINPDVWINRLNREKQYFEEYYGIESFIVTDLRQLNEYSWLKEQGFTVLKVETAPEVRLERIKKSGDVFNMQDLLHPVEREIASLPYDYLLTNNDTLDALFLQVDFVLNELKHESGVK